MSHRGRYRPSNSRPRIPRGAPVASHIALGSTLALALRQITNILCTSDPERLTGALHSLIKAIERFKCKADDQVFRQFPLITGFGTHTIGRIYYCGANPLSDSEMRALVRFEEKLDALQIPRSNNAEMIGRHIAAGTLAPARISRNQVVHRWKPGISASELLRIAVNNFAEMTTTPDQSLPDDYAARDEEEE